MRMYCLKNYLLFCIFFSQIIDCTVISAERWELYAKEGVPSTFSNLKTIYLLSDAHERREINREQLKELLHFLRSKGVGTSFIAEDPNTFNDNKLFWKELNQYVKKNNIPLRNSISLAHQCGILATSVEFRPCTSRFWGEVYIQDIVDTTDEQVEIIARYNDGSLLNSEYREYLKRYKSVVVPVAVPLFKNIDEQKCSIRSIDYSILVCPKESDVLVELYGSSSDVDHRDLKQHVGELITCYAQEVIDFKILHALAEHAKKGASTTVIYAGGAHIDRIKPVLSKLGYCFYKYSREHVTKGDINSPLYVAKAFEEMDPTYDANEVLPKETVDYFFEYKEAEENNPCFATRSAMKLFVAAADVLSRYKSWKQVYPRLDNLFKAMLSVGAASAAIWVLKVCCGPK